MDYQDKLTALRASTGMNRREFCEYFQIPYRTVQDWEAGKRAMPPYLFRLMKYKAEMEGLLRKKAETSGREAGSEGEADEIK